MKPEICTVEGGAHVLLWCRVDLLSMLCRFSDHFAVMFGVEPPPWDRERRYTPSTIEASLHVRACLPKRLTTTENVCVCGGGGGGGGTIHIVLDSSLLLQVYYEEQCTGGLCSVSPQSTLAQVLSSPGYKVVDGTPSFILLAAGTEFREQYLTRNRST